VAEQVTHKVRRRWWKANEWLPGWAQILLALGAIGAGLALAHLPLLWAAVGLLVVILLALTLIDPLAGVGVALVLGPTKPLTDYYVPQLPIDLGQIALLVTLGAWFLHAVRRRDISVPRSPFNAPLLIFVGAASLSLLNALSLGFALKELIKWGQLLLVMWLVIDLTGERRWQAVVGLVLGAAVAQALIGVWQFGLRGKGPEHFLILDDRFYRAYGTFEQPNPYGGFIGMVLPLALGLALGALALWAVPVCEAWRAGRPIRLDRLVGAALNEHLWGLVGLALLSGLLLAALLMSWSRGAWLGFGAAALVMLVGWPRKTWLGVALVVGALVLGYASLRFNLLPGAIASRLTGFAEYVQTFDVRGVDISSGNFSVIERLAHWQAAEEMARYHPWLGIGLGNYEPVYPAYALLNWSLPLGHAHNIYLNLLAETGIIGLLAYLLLWGCVFWQTWQVTRHEVNAWRRSVALGLLGTWTHLSMHQFWDKLYVANLHLHMGALLGALSILIYLDGETEALERNNRHPVIRIS
jgi:putative inorganic carbon (HCO3(-)) transporter